MSRSKLKEPPIKGYVIRTSDGTPVMIDPSVQVLPSGKAVELTFLDPDMAEAVLDQVSKRNAGDGVRFTLVEKSIKPNEIAWAMDKDDIHDKALEEERIKKNMGSA